MKKSHLREGLEIPKPPKGITHAQIKCGTKKSTVTIDNFDTFRGVEGMVRWGKQKKNSKTGIERRLSEEEIDAFRSQNLGDAMASLSGVSAIKNGNAIVKPMVHGLSGSRLAIVNDGIRLQDHEWGTDHAPSIDEMVPTNYSS